MSNEDSDDSLVEFYEDDSMTDASSTEDSTLLDLDEDGYGGCDIKIPNYIERDRIRFAPNIGALKAVTRKLKERPKPYWLTKDVKFLNLVKLSDYIEPNKACDTLINAMHAIDPNKFPYDLYYEEENSEEEEIDKSMPYNVEQLFLNKVQVSEDFFKNNKFGLPIPVETWVAETYKSELFPVDVSYDWCMQQVYHKIAPFCLVKLVSDIVIPNKKISLYRLSIDAYVDIIAIRNCKPPENIEQANCGEEMQFLVPRKCANVVNLMNQEDYNMIRSMEKCHTTKEFR